VFRLTGYLPIFPLVFREKAAMLTGRNPASVYSLDGRTVFRASLARRVGADALDAAAAAGDALERQLGKVAPETRAAVSDGGQSGCRAPWGPYCESVSDAVTYALERHAQVLVAGEPLLLGHMREHHRTQQRELAAMLER